MHGENTDTSVTLPMRRSPTAERQELAFLVESYYAVQKIRVEAGNRVAALGKEGIVPLLALKLHHDFVDDRMERMERELRGKIEALVKGFPIWTEWMQNVKGLGPILAGGCLAWVDPANFSNPSKVHRYCGLAVINGQAEQYVRGEKAHFSRRLRTLSWKISDSMVKQGEGYRDLYEQHRLTLSQYGLFPKGASSSAKAVAIGYSQQRAWEAGLASELIPLRGNLSLMLEKERHAAMLLALKEKYESRLMWEKPCGKLGDHLGYTTDPLTGKREKILLQVCTDAHKDMKARRWMVKIFWTHYWEMSRRLEGLSTVSPYALSKLPKHTTLIPVIQR